MASAPPRTPPRPAPSAPHPPPENTEEVPVGRMSPSLSHFAPAFVQVQMKLRPVIKRSENPHFKSTFANLGDILEGALPILGDHGFAIMQFPTTDERGGLALMSMLIHESGQYVAATMPLMVVKQDPQGEGSAISYGRRYAACAILGIRTADDDGNAGSGRPIERRSPEPALSELEVVPPKTPGWADADAEASAHKAVASQIKTLYESIPEDHPVRAAIKEHRDSYGWPMVPDALTALAVMVAGATTPSAPQDAPPRAAGSESQPAPSAATPVPPSAPAEVATVCPWCRKAIGAQEPTVMLPPDGGDPARPMHASCHAEWQEDEASRPK